MRATTIRNAILLSLMMTILAFINSCTTKSLKEDLNPGKNLSLSFETRSPESDVVDNMRLFSFYRGGTNDKKLYRELLNLGRNNNVITTSHEVGNYYMSLVSAPSGTTIINPTPGTPLMEAMPMYTYTPSVNPLTFKSDNAAEIWFSNVQLPTIIADNTHNVNVDMARNLAMVELIIVKASPSFSKTPTTPHSIKLHHIPSRISYTGALLPSKTNPDTLSAPLQSRLTLLDQAGATGFLESDTVRFLIPAHRGTDFTATTPTDVTTLKMKVSVDLERIGGGSRLTKTKEIPVVAMHNKVLRVRITVDDGVELGVEVLDWKRVDQSTTVGEGYSNWIYVKKGSTGSGQSWRDAAPTINDALSKVAGLRAAGYTVHGILVAGGSATANIYNETLNIPAGVRVFGGWEGVSGTELSSSDANAPYTSTNRKLATHKAVLSPGSQAVTITGANTTLDGFVIQSATSGGVSVTGSAYINAVEIRNNTFNASALTLNNATASNVLVANNTQGIAISNSGKLINGTVVNNTGTSTSNGGTILNSVIWGNTISLTGTNTIQYCLFPNGSVPTGTGNLPLHVSNNTAWFTTGNVIPGPHFDLTTYAAGTTTPNRAPMLGRGNQNAFDNNTPFMTTAATKKDINGNDRHHNLTDMGCYESTGTLKGFELRWNMSDVYISTKALIESDHPAILFDNAEGAYVEWSVAATSIISSRYTLVAGSSTGSGNTTDLGLFRLKSGSTANTTANDVDCGTITLSSQLGAYLPNTVIGVKQTPGRSNVWPVGYAGSFHKNNETSERLISGVNTGGGEWTVRIVSGLDWIKIDNNSPGFNGGEVVEVFGGAITSSAANITFRVGMKSTLPPGHAPRYGLITILRGTGSNRGVALFFVRQGEEADYLYSPSDPRALGARTEAIKFSPYNLTDPQGRFNTAGISLGKNGGGLTDYPSKTGYFFKWNGYVAYYPDNSQTGTNLGGTNSYKTGAWDVNNEPCPPGYFTPSELQWVHSYFYNRNSQETGSGSATGSTFVWGRLADGYFDKYAAVGAHSYGTGPNRATEGLLMYNDYTNASVFFPQAGYRGNTTAFNDDNIEWTQTSTPRNTNNMWHTHSYGTGTTGHLGMACTQRLRSEGLSVRCVKL